MSGRPAAPAAPGARAPAENHAASARRELVDTVCGALTKAGDPERAAGQQRYMKSALPFHGLTTPQLRETLRPILDNPAYRMEDRPQWEATVRALWDGATHREQRYAATALAGHRHYRPWQDTETLGLYRHLAVTGAWWDHVDDIASHLVGPILRADPDRVAPVLRRWAEADDMWLRRTAILAQLGSKAGTDSRLLADCLTANLAGSRFGAEFFVRKAIGWALREHAKTDPDWVRAFVSRHAARLSPVSRREATKHL